MILKYSASEISDGSFFSSVFFVVEPNRRYEVIYERQHGDSVSKSCVHVSDVSGGRIVGSSCISGAEAE